MTLKIAEDFTLPDEAVTSTFGYLAVRGAGKSNAARVTAEQMFRAGLPFVAVDPVGSWFGLRIGRDGSPGGGLPIPIFGGKHGDLPLHRSAGEQIADVIVDQRLSCVLDLTSFDSEGDRKAFLLAFARRIYTRNESPLHLFLEEADDYIPQRPMRDEAQLLRAWENIVRRGRARGLGITLITQRSASVNKNVLTQVETLFVLRTTGPQDIAAINEWVKYHQVDQKMLATLAGLKNGEAWVWSPHFLSEIRRIKFRLSETYDSGATPKNVRGTDARPRATLADIDLGELHKRLGAAIEQAKADDPKALRKRIAELEGELREARASNALPMGTLRAIVTELSSAADQLGAAVGLLHELGDGNWAVAGDGPQTSPEAPTKPSNGEVRQGEHRYAAALEPEPVRKPPEKINRAREIQPESRNATTGVGEGAPPLAKIEQNLLAAWSKYGRLPLAEAALLAGYAPSAGSVFNAAGRLRSLGYAEGGNSEGVAVTPEGRARVRRLAPLPDGPGLVIYWSGKLAKVERLILQQVIAAYPNPVPLEKAARQAGYAPSAGSVFNAAGHLRSLGLVSGSNAGMTAYHRLT